MYILAKHDTTFHVDWQKVKYHSLKSLHYLEPVSVVLVRHISSIFAAYGRIFIYKYLGIPGLVEQNPFRTL
jgi:hypothetical protein